MYLLAAGPLSAPDLAPPTLQQPAPTIKYLCAWRIHIELGFWFSASHHQTGLAKPVPASTHSTRLPHTRTEPAPEHTIHIRTTYYK